MGQIHKVYVVNHTHHDIGFNDYQDVAFRQHGEFVGQALDLIEATADAPEESRYRWVCEVSGPLLRYLRGAGRGQVERFRHWQQQGAIDIAAMQYNLTPLLTPEQMYRSLYPVRILREEYGLSVETAMQDDVNGVSWMFADLLPTIGVDFLTMAINQSRGRAPRPFPGGFWWQGPAGNKLLTWNGLHYLFGRSQAKLGDWRYAEEALSGYIDRFENDEDWPYDFIYCEATHPMRVDNGPPDARIAEFVQEWNAQGRTPVIEFTTPRAFRDLLLSQWSHVLPTWRGDWTDWWSDGAGSSAYETGVNRATHELLPATEMISSWLRSEGRSSSWNPDLAEQISETMTLFDEHTWGAFSSIEAPEHLFTKAQWNKKAGYAYEASMLTHDLLARNARELADSRSDAFAEGRFNLGDLTDQQAYPDPSASDAELMIINTLPWERDVDVEVPEMRAGGAPAGMLEAFFARGVPWGGPPDTPLARVRARVPGFGYTFAKINSETDRSDLVASADLIENEFYQVRVGQDGTVVSWIDKASGHDFAGANDHGGLGSYLHEVVADPKGRDALYEQDFGSWDFGYWQVDPDFDRQGPTEVIVEPAVLEVGEAVIQIVVRARGVKRALCRISLPSRSRSLQIDWTLDKEHQTDPESVYVSFPFNLEDPGYHVDLNGVACEPNVDQLPGVSFDWYPIRRWAYLGEEGRGVAVVPLDAPLVQLGGITTGKIADQLEPERPEVVSWALNNHWMVNFKASQGGEIPLRYRLTTFDGAFDVASVNRFAEDVATPPIVLRDYQRRAEMTGQFMEVGGDGIEATLKPASFGDGIILRLRNLTAEAQSVPLRFTVPPLRIVSTSLLEEDADADKTGTDEVEIGPHELLSYRILY